jgi:hypothetical protein
MGRVRVGAVVAAVAIAGCGGGGSASLHAKVPRTISTSTPTLLPVSAHSSALNCPFHDGKGGQGVVPGQTFELR